MDRWAQGSGGVGLAHDARVRQTQQQEDHHSEAAGAVAVLYVPLKLFAVLFNPLLVLKFRTVFVAIVGVCTRCAILASLRLITLAILRVLATVILHVGAAVVDVSAWQNQQGSASALR